MNVSYSKWYVDYLENILNCLFSILKYHWKFLILHITSYTEITIIKGSNDKLLNNFGKAVTNVGY